MSKRETFCKIDIVKKIAKKTNNTIQIRLLYDVIDLINKYISDEISANKTFSVEKFGTIYQATGKPKLMWSHAQQKEITTIPRTKIKFAMHHVFSKLLKDKRKNIIEVLKTEK